MNYEYAIRTTTQDGTPTLIPLAFGMEEEVGKILADQYVEDREGLRKHAGEYEIDWSRYQVVRREVGEWEIYEGDKE